jgi:palmitoyl transferase
MKIFYLCLILLIPAIVEAKTESKQYCLRGPLLIKRVCNRLNQIWNEGKTDLYITGYAWHNRYTYRPEKIKEFNEFAWGGGLGKGFYDEDGDWHGLVAVAFKDSHNKVEPAAGYAFLKIARLNEDWRIGAGYFVLITARPDVLHGIPFPGAAPWISLIYRKTSLSASYLPGAQGAGNVLFIFGRHTLDL